MLIPFVMYKIRLTVQIRFRITLKVRLSATLILRFRIRTMFMARATFSDMGRGKVSFKFIARVNHRLGWLVERLCLAAYLTLWVN